MNQGRQWDDSALVESWNEALEEYKIYHSIYSKGSNVDDFEREYPKVDESTSGTDVLCGQADELDGLGSDGERTLEQKGEASRIADKHCKEALSTEEKDLQPSGDGACQGSATIPIQTFLGSVDENLKRLLMSWYYAGYYLGLYDGQQKTGQQKTRQPPS